MAEADPSPERLSPNLKAEIKELTRVVKALVKAFQSVEEETGEVYMPAGEYYGIKFEE